MTEVRLKYLHSFVDRHGHVRYYFRYRGNRWTLPGPHEEGFATAYDALLTQIRAASRTANPKRWEASAINRAIRSCGHRSCSRWPT